MSSLEPVVAPQVGESIKEVRILSWKKNSGDLVRSGDVLLEIETDKASVEVAAQHSGKLEIIKKAEETVDVGSLVGNIDTTVKVRALLQVSQPILNHQAHLLPLSKLLQNRAGILLDETKTLFSVKPA
ncbi:MAG: lipoyl domain-containing protein [Bdellovibrionota bacterium]